MTTRIPTLLIVDDDKSSIEILLAKLGEHHALIPTLSGSRALEVLQTKPIDLILLDIEMPDMDGFELATRLKQNPPTRDIPIIFITARQDEASIERAFQVGGVDYVQKPFLTAELLARIQTHLKIRDLINHLDHLSSYDQLTGIRNRRVFFELGLQQFEQAAENLSAIMIDIDNFKRINDRYGHAAGDQMICAVADVLKENLDEETLFARIGGEEFVILLHSSDEEEILHRMEVLRKKVEELRVSLPSGQSLACSISCGASLKHAETGNLDTLLHEADMAMYQAKMDGKNQCRFRIPDMNSI